MALELSEKEKTVYANIPEDERQKLLEYIQKTAEGKNVEPHFRPILESVVKGTLSYWRKSLRDELDLSEQPQTGDQELDVLLDAVAGNGGTQSRSILEEDMQNIAEKDMPHARVLIRKFARQMVARITRRYRLSKKHKQLDLRRSIRHNLRFGGTMFHLRYRCRRIQKPRLILLCDVSGSMARYAVFVLQFIYGINSVVGSIESFVFSEDLERVTEFFHHGNDFNGTMVDVINRSAEWGRGTNLTAALRSLRREYASLQRCDAYVIIVSDTQTIALTEAVQELLQLKRKVKDIVWLNTLAKHEWEHARTVHVFSSIVTMIPCNTLSDLEKITRGKVFL